jgi:hypothetical protein
MWNHFLLILITGNISYIFEYYSFEKQKSGKSLIRFLSNYFEN